MTPDSWMLACTDAMGPVGKTLATPLQQHVSQCCLTGNVSEAYVLSFSRMLEPCRLSRASGSVSHFLASAGLTSSSTSVAVPTPPTMLCRPWMHYHCMMFALASPQ